MDLQLVLQVPPLIVTRFDNGDIIEWSAGYWNRGRVKAKIQHHDDVGNIVDPDLFNVINNYLAVLSIDDRCSIEQGYREAFHALNTVTEIYRLDSMLMSAINKIFSPFIWHHFVEWLIVYGNVNLEIGRKDALNEKQSLERTYFTKDYAELVAFSVMLKLIMPIWGNYERIVKTTLNSDHMLIHGVELIQCDTVVNCPAYIKLCQHINNYITAELQLSGFSIMGGIGYEEMPEFLLAMVLWKKVIIFDPRSHEHSIVSDVHNLLFDKCKRLVITGPAQKMATNVKGEDVPVTDMFKTQQKIAPGIIVMIEHFIEEHALMAFMPITESMFNEVNRCTPPVIPMNELSGFVLSLLFGNSIGIRTKELITIKSIILLTQVGVLKLKALGYPTLAAMLIGIAIPKDTTQHIFSDNQYIARLSESQIKAINALYSDSHIAGRDNPAIKMFDIIAKELSVYNWSHYTIIDNEVYEEDIELLNLMIELANLLLYTYTTEEK